MKYDEIIKLLDAGYSRDEIIAMEEPNDEQENSSGSGTDEAENLNDTTGMAELVNEMREAFGELKKEFTAFNIMASRQPEEKTPEDIIASIINPTRKENKKGDK